MGRAAVPPQPSPPRRRGAIPDCLRPPQPVEAGPDRRSRREGPGSRLGGRDDDMGPGSGAGATPAFAGAGGRGPHRPPSRAAIPATPPPAPARPNRHPREGGGPSLTVCAAAAGRGRAGPPRLPGESGMGPGSGAGATSGGRTVRLHGPSPPRRRGAIPDCLRRRSRSRQGRATEAAGRVRVPARGPG